jgi:hypothetical protein
MLLAVATESRQSAVFSSFCKPTALEKRKENGSCGVAGHVSLLNTAANKPLQSWMEHLDLWCPKLVDLSAGIAFHNMDQETGQACTGMVAERLRGIAAAQSTFTKLNNGV